MTTCELGPRGDVHKFSVHLCYDAAVPDSTDLFIMLMFENGFQGWNLIDLISDLINLYLDLMVPKYVYNPGA